MPLSRRQFLVGCSSAIAALAGGRLTGMAFGEPSANPTRDIVVVVFLRGGWDALGVVAPLDDDLFQAARIGLTFPASGTGGGHLLGTLNSTPLWLHPKAAPLYELFTQRELAIVHACGLASGTRSHFDAMDFLERGIPNDRTSGHGWLARHLGLVNAPGSIPTISAGASLAKSLWGDDAAVAYTNVQNFKLPGGSSSTATLQRQALNAIYANDESILGPSVRRMLAAMESVQQRNPQPYDPDVEYPPENNVRGFTDALKAIAHTIKLDLGLEVATVDFGGWDTHEGQNYFLPLLVEGFARSLHAFYNDLAAYHQRLSIVVISEFGRRLKANRSGGTDHGHGGVAMVLGGNVNGGHIFGQWPGLANEQLDHGVDLAITTDIRQLLSELVIRRMSNTAIDQVFPGMPDYRPLHVFKGRDPVWETIASNKAYIPTLRR